MMVLFYVFILFYFISFLAIFKNKQKKNVSDRVENTGYLVSQPASQLVILKQN